MQRVVIVDDDDLNLRLLRGIVEELPDTSAATFNSSAEALEWARNRVVDCFIVDYHMPKPDGLELTGLLRTIERFATVPIVMVTGAHERDVRYAALDAGANDFIEKPFDRRELLARLTTLLALQKAQSMLAMQVGSLESTLLESEDRSRRHADRLQALWQIATNVELAEEERIAAMLRQGAAAIRPGEPFQGVLSRLEGDFLIVEAVAAPADVVPLAAGMRIPVAETMFAQTLRHGRTVSRDLPSVASLSLTARGLGWSASVSSPLRAGGATYSLAFGSTQPMFNSFSPEDYAYIEVIAAFFATHFQQRWQSMRIRHQLDHDSLTGLQNRTRFRSVGRAAFQAAPKAAIAVIDLASFRELNEEHGHLIGDAVLVEVAAGLAALAREGEVVARVGGDSFAIFFPHVGSEGWLAERLEQLRTIFDVPIPIGDREGREGVEVSATIGVARAPDDATTFDQLLFRAEGMTAAGELVAGPIRFFSRT